MSNSTPAEGFSSDDDSYEMIDVSIVKNGVEAMSLEEEMEIVTHSDVEDPDQRKAPNTIDNVRKISNEAVVQFEDDQPSTSSSFVGVSMKKTKKERLTFGPTPISKKAKDRRLRWETLSDDKKATFTEEASRLRLPIRVVANDPEELPCNTSSCPTFSRHEIAIKERKLNAKPWIDNFLKERKMEEKRKEKSYRRRTIINLNKKYKKTSYHLSSSSESNDSDDYNGEPFSSNQMSREEALARSLSMMSGSSMYDRVKGRRSGSKMSNRMRRDEERRTAELESLQRRRQNERIEAEQQMKEILERKKTDMRDRAAAMAKTMFSEQQQEQQELLQQLMQQVQPESSEQHGLPQELMRQLLIKLPASTPKAQVRKLIDQMKQGLQLQQQGESAQVHVQPQPPARSDSMMAQPSSAAAAASSSGAAPQDFAQQQLLLQADIAQQMRTMLQQTGTLSPSLQLQQQMQQLKTGSPYNPDEVCLSEMLGTEKMQQQTGDFGTAQKGSADAQDVQSLQLLATRLTRTELQELVLQLLAMHPDSIEQTQQEVVVESDEQQQMNKVARDAATAAVSALNANAMEPGRVVAAVEAAANVFEVNRPANEAMDGQTATGHLDDLELARHLQLLNSARLRAQQQPGFSASTQQLRQLLGILPAITPEEQAQQLINQTLLQQQQGTVPQAHVEAQRPTASARASTELQQLQWLESFIPREMQDDLLGGHFKPIMDSMRMMTSIRQLQEQRAMGQDVAQQMQVMKQQWIQQQLTIVPGIDQAQAEQAFTQMLSVINAQQQQPGASVSTSHQLPQDKQQLEKQQQHLIGWQQVADAARQVESFMQRRDLLSAEVQSQQQQHGASSSTPEHLRLQSQQLQQEMQQALPPLMQLLMRLLPVGTAESDVRQLIEEIAQDRMQPQGATKGEQALQKLLSLVFANSPLAMDTTTQLEISKQVQKLLDSAQQQQPGPSHSTPRYSFP